MNPHCVEVSVAALRHNAAVFRGLAGGARLMGVVKSNAYGHGLELTVRALQGQVDWFGVNSIGEYAALRAVDARTPVLVMGLNSLELDAAEELRRLYPQAPPTLVLSSVADLERLAARAPELPFHVKVDTGLSRLGASGQAWQACLAFLAERPALRWTGVMTHFANVEDVSDQAYALLQLQRFKEARTRAELHSRGRVLLHHAAASAAALILPESRLDLLRVGISLYGLWPSAQTRLSAHALYGAGQGPGAAGPPELRPALRWITRIAHVHDVASGAAIGYGCTERVERDTRVAVLPTGYYEGYDRALSNRGAYVLIHGRRARVLGRVSMNMIIVDVSLIPEAAPGDEAVLIGRQGAEEASADFLAGLTGSINYEVVTRIHGSIPRVAVAQGA